MAPEERASPSPARPNRERLVQVRREGRMSKKVVFRSKGSVFRSQRDDLTSKRLVFRSIHVGSVSEWEARASISVRERGKSAHLSDRMRHFAPIEDSNSSFAHAKPSKKIGNRGEIDHLTSKKVVNRRILVRFLPRAGRNRDSSARARRCADRIRLRQLS
jgi:hypothetical protein